jgi:hypothetical protein
MHKNILNTFSGRIGEKAGEQLRRILMWCRRKIIKIDGLIFKRGKGNFVLQKINF